MLNGDPGALGGDGWELNAAAQLNVGSPQRAALNELINGGRVSVIEAPRPALRLGRTR